MRRFWLLLAVMLATGVCTGAACAAPASVSYSVWNVDGPAVRVRFVLPMSEAQALAPDVPRLDSAGAAAAAGALLSVSSAAGDCTTLVQDQWVGKYYVLAIARQSYRFEMRFACPDAQGIVLHDRVLFDKAPDHIDYASVQVGSAAPTLLLFTRDHQDIALPASGPAPSESLAPFVTQGFGRLLEGADAAALVMGLLLLARRWGDLLGVAAALAVGYAAAFVVGLGGAVAPDLALAEAGMGAVAAVLGLCALRLQAGERPAARRWTLAGVIGAGLVAAGLLAAAAFRGLSAALLASGLLVFGLALAWIAGLGSRLRLLLFAPAALFGLLDGARWLQGLEPLRLPGYGLASGLFGYELGAALALSAASAAAMVLMWLAGRKLGAMRAFGADLAAATLTGLGLFLFVSRLYGG